jgi:hypothetical protein
LREFLKEYVIIVIGVLTALAAEQAAEALHTRHIIAESEQAMRSELADDDLLQAYVRTAVAPCLTADLRRMRQAVADRAPIEGFATLADAYNPPVRTWDMSAWTATLSGAAGSRMASSRLLAWSKDYIIIPNLQAAAVQEVEALHRLQRTRFRAGAWSAQRADELNDDIDDLETSNQMMTRRAASLELTAAGQGIAVPGEQRAQLLDQARKAYGACVAEPDVAALKQISGQVLTVEGLHTVDRAFGIDRR